MLSHGDLHPIFFSSSRPPRFPLPQWRLSALWRDRRGGARSWTEVGKEEEAAAEAGIGGNHGRVSRPSRRRFWTPRTGGSWPRALCCASLPPSLHPFRATEHVVRQSGSNPPFCRSWKAARLPALFFPELRGATGGRWRGGRMARILATRRERDRWLVLGFGAAGAGARSPLSLCGRHGGCSTRRCCDCERE